MRYGSVCSGIEAATAAWHPLGWEASFFSEIEAFPSAVLKHHYPDVPNFGDMTKFQEWPDVPIDLLVGGTPCQSFSVAGLRAGLADPRGNLLLTYLAIAARYRPRWLVWENVPGVLSSTSHDAPDPLPPPNPMDLELGGQEVVVSDEYDAIETHAFGTLLAGLSELGYGFAYRVLDAQFCRAHGLEYAVPQRRRRVFVVGCLGSWAGPAAVFLDAPSLRGDSPPRREAGKGVAPTISARPTGGGGLGTDFDLDGGLVQVAPTLRAGGNKTGGDRPPGTDVDTADSLIAVAGTLGQRTTDHPNGMKSESDFIVPVAIPFDTTQITSAANRSQPKAGDPMHPLAAGAHAPAIAFAQQAGGDQTTLGYDPNSGTAPTLSSHQTPGVHHGWAVRRLTPTECERLQGFPDNYTAIPIRGKRAADGPRYKALGNSMAVNVMRVIGERIAMVDAILDVIKD